MEEAKILFNNGNTECSFSTICVNVRSLMNPHNFSKFESLISGLDFKPHIIAVNETWEKPHLTGQFKNLQDYVYVSNPRVISRDGGVGIVTTIPVVEPLFSFLCYLRYRITFILIYFETRQCFVLIIISYSVFNNQR